MILSYLPLTKTVNLRFQLFPKMSGRRPINAPLVVYLGTVCFRQPTPSVLNLVVAAILRDSVLGRVIAALCGILLLHVVYCIRLSGLP